MISVTVQVCAEEGGAPSAVPRRKWSVTSPETRVSSSPSRVASAPCCKRSREPGVLLHQVRLEQAIIVVAGCPVQSIRPSVTSYDELMVLQPAFADNEPFSKVSRTVLPGTRSCPSTLVDSNVLPSRSADVTADPVDEEPSDAVLSTRSRRR